jgi:DNA-binding IclR family transcriptional regulator
VVHRLGRCQLGAQAAGSSLARSLAAASGLPKSSAYRLAEHLAVLGVVQRVNHRYHIEAGISRISGVRSAWGYRAPFDS